MTNKTRKDCLHFDGVWCALHEDDDDDCPSVCKDFADGKKCLVCNGGGGMFGGNSMGDIGVIPCQKCNGSGKGEK